MSFFMIPLDMAQIPLKPDGMLMNINKAGLILGFMEEL